MDLLDRLLGHDHWTTRRLLLIAADLPTEQLDTDFDIGRRTLRATFLHIVRNVEIWSGHMAGELLSYRPEPHPETVTISELITRLDFAHDRLARIARDVRACNGWDQKWTDMVSDPPTQKSYGGAIAHVITHSMHHRAQILHMLRRLGVKDLPEGDVLSWEHRAGEN